MRLIVLTLVVVLLAACTNTDASPPFFDMDYQVRCRGMCNNSVDEPPRTISHLDGEAGYVVDCEVSPSGSMRAKFTCLGAEEECAGDYAFEIADVKLDGGDPGMGCSVIVREGANTYEGRCTATEPTADAPCQVVIEESAGEITGSVACLDVKNAANQYRSLYMPQTEMPAEFKILNCSGL